MRLRLSESLYKNYVENTEQLLILNMKYFRIFIKDTREETSFPPSMFLGDEEASNDCRISQLFFKRFGSITYTIYSSYFHFTYCPPTYDYDYDHVYRVFQSWRRSQNVCAFLRQA